MTQGSVGVLFYVLPLSGEEEESVEERREFFFRPPSFFTSFHFFFLLACDDRSHRISLCFLSSPAPSCSLFFPLLDPASDARECKRERKERVFDFFEAPSFFFLMRLFSSVTEPSVLW